jgi:putative lipoic acid-binding regulatory protein
MIATCTVNDRLLGYHSRFNFQLAMPRRGSAILAAMSSDAPERVSFPCDYPIKVMVRVEDGVRSHVDAIVERHAGPLDLAAVTERPSARGNFLGITYVIRATGQDQIAQLFAALKLCPQVMLVL